MKKPSFIIGKKQIILSCLTLMLAIAVYVNYALSDEAIQTAEEQTPDGGITYGDTAFVNADADTDSSQAAEETADAAEVSETAGAYSTAETQEDVDTAVENASSVQDYFAQARLERTASRDESVAALQAMLGGGDRTEDELVTDAIAAVETSKRIESESNIESLIKAQGFPDCIAYLDDTSARVVVQTEGLDAAQAAAIKDIILGETAISAENIRIFEVK